LDVTNATAAKYEMNMTAAGPGTLLDLSLGFVASPSSLGIYPASQGGDVFFTMRSTRIELLIGARSSARAGFLHVGIVD
ncbi:MAG: hypothetical protein KA795_14700, partial [Burkholderiaceae bacterium]|nr:hypothetical protein [Burkholderiaceae bacterium]